jgi:diaminopropionate ammonia-lyase
VNPPEVILERNPHPVRRVLPDRPPDRSPLDFHRALPGYAPTPLRRAPLLAADLGVGELWLKDESWRLGLPAFKIAGASWAVARALEAHLGVDIDPAGGLDALRAAIGWQRPMLMAATDGNHGRAVARMAKLLGLPARIFVPDDMVAARRAAIAGEGAEVVEVAGSYDEAVARSAAEADDTHIVVSDTSWPGYEDVPRAVIDGYSTLMWEVDDALRAAGAADPDLVLVQVGVGALAAAVTRHYRRPGLAKPPLIVAVEPTRAACVLASIRAGELVTIPGPQDSIMAGLNCGTPSPIAWPTMVGGIDFFCAIDDEVAREGMRDVAREGVAAGECSGGAIGAARALLTGPHRQSLAISSDAGVLVLLTEGATDPAGYEKVVGRSPESVTGSPPGGAPAP